MSVCVGTQPLPAKPLGRSDSLGSRARFVWRSAGEVRVAQKWLHSSRGSEKTGGLLEAGSPRHRLTGGLWPCAGVPGPLLGHKGGRVPGEGVLPTEEGAGGEAGTRSRVVAGAGVRRGPAELEGSWVFPPASRYRAPKRVAGFFPGRRRPEDARPQGWAWRRSGAGVGAFPGKRGWSREGLGPPRGREGRPVRRAAGPDTAPFVPAATPGFWGWQSVRGQRGDQPWEPGQHRRALGLPLPTASFAISTLSPIAHRTGPVTCKPG